MDGGKQSRSEQNRVTEVEVIATNLNHVQKCEVIKSQGVNFSDISCEDDQGRIGD